MTRWAEVAIGQRSRVEHGPSGGQDRVVCVYFVIEPVAHQREQCARCSAGSTRRRATAVRAEPDHALWTRGDQTHARGGRARWLCNVHACQHIQPVQDLRVLVDRNTAQGLESVHRSESERPGQPHLGNRTASATLRADRHDHARQGRVRGLRFPLACLHAGRGLGACERISDVRPLSAHSEMFRRTRGSVRVDQLCVIAPKIAAYFLWLHRARGLLCRCD